MKAAPVTLITSAWAEPWVSMLALRATPAIAVLPVKYQTPLSACCAAIWNSAGREKICGNFLHGILKLLCELFLPERKKHRCRATLHPVAYRMDWRAEEIMSLYPIFLKLEGHKVL